MAIYNRFTFLVIYTFLMICFNVSHADEWRYDSDLKIPSQTFKGRYYVENTPVNPDFSYAKLNVDMYKRAMGRIMFNRIFASSTPQSQYSQLGVQALVTRLQVQDYEIDYSARKILKYSDEITQFQCPEALTWHNTLAAAGVCFEKTYTALDTVYDYKVTNYQEADPSIGEGPKIHFDRCPRNGSGCFYGGAFRINTRKVRQVIEEMDTYLLGTFMIAENVSVFEAFYYGNTYEYLSNPLVKTVVEKFKVLPTQWDSPVDQTSPNDATNDNNPTANGVPEPQVKMEMPALCNWAQPACDFFTYMKNSFTEFVNWSKDMTGIGAEDGTVDVDHDPFNTGAQSYDPSSKGQFVWGNKTCPPDYPLVITLFGLSNTFPISYGTFCEFFKRLSVIFIFGSYLAGAFIIAGVRNA